MQHECSTEEGCRQLSRPAAVVVRATRNPPPSYDTPTAGSPTAASRAAGVLGRPAPAEELFQVITNQGMPVKLSNIDNLRSVMSRGEEFINKAPGLWWLAGVESKANPQPDLPSEQLSQNGSNGHQPLPLGPETQEAGRNVHPASS